MEMAHIVVEVGRVDTSFVVQANEDGQYAFALSEPGGYGLYVNGLHHQTLTMPFVVKEYGAVNLDIRLPGLQQKTEIDSLWVTSPSFGEDKRLMQSVGQGVFTLTINSDSDTLAYQIFGATKNILGSTNEIAGTQYDYVAFNDAGPFWDRKSDYFSVINSSNGRFEITFESENELNRDTTYQVQSTPSYIARISDIHLDANWRARLIGMHYRDILPGYDTNNESELEQFREAFQSYVDLIKQPVFEQIEQENDSFVKQWLMMQYFDELVPSEDDSLLARQMLREIPVTSPYWSFEAWSNVGASNLIFQIARIAKADSLSDAYIDRAIALNEDPDVRSHFLYRAIGMADYAGDEERKWRYYTQLINEHGEGYHARQMRRQYSKTRLIQPGNAMPSFSFVSLRDSNAVLTDEMLKGKPYIMDFWGTWCGPCIQEIPHLEQAYDTYKQEGLEILSVAMMDDRAAIEQFWEERHVMPWLHTLVIREDDSKIREAFEITSFPRPVFVNSDGIIHATDESLRGDSLFMALEEYFDQ